MQTKDILIVSVLFFITSCGQLSRTTEYTVDIDTVTFPLTNPTLLTSRSHSDLALDSLTKRKWTDIIVGRNAYYSATYLAKFNKFMGHHVIAIETNADDWGKSFLLVVNENMEMVDYLEITDEYGDATQDDKGGETVTGITARTQFINDSSLVRTRIHETIYSYQGPEELTEKDSITEDFVIEGNGRFKKIKKDSVRTRE